MAELFEETESVKLRFIRAYERLHELGQIAEEELEEVIDALDRMDELSQEELAEKLGRFKKLDLEQEVRKRLVRGKESRLGSRRRRRPGGRGSWSWSSWLCAVRRWASTYHVCTPKEVMIVDRRRGAVSIVSPARTVGEALRPRGIVLAAGRRGHACPGRPCSRRARRIKIARGMRAALLVDGQRARGRRSPGTVRDALVQAGIRMGPLDRVVPVRETPLEDGMRIRVIRVTQEEVVETESHSLPHAALGGAPPGKRRRADRARRQGRYPRNPGPPHL